jgi:hypothetical protein
MKLNFLFWLYRSGGSSDGERDVVGSEERCSSAIADVITLIVSSHGTCSVIMRILRGKQVRSDEGGSGSIERVKFVMEVREMEMG